MELSESSPAKGCISSDEEDGGDAKDDEVEEDAKDEEDEMDEKDEEDEMNEVGGRTGWVEEVAWWTKYWYCSETSN